MSENSFSLIVALPGEEPVAHELQGDAITFGRSPENQIQVLVAEVSVRPGQLVREGDGYRVVDPGSTNGTRVNGQPVGPQGVVLNPMDRLLLGTLVPAYFVPSSMLAANAPAQLIATIEASAPPARVKTAPVSVAAPAAAAPGVRSAVPLAAPAPAAPGGPATVKLDQVRAPGPGVRPAPVPTSPRLPATPAAGAPPAPGAPAPAPLRPPGVAPVAPPSAPAAPGAPAPVRPAGPPAAAVPVKPAAGVIPVKPVSGASTVPIKRVAPSAPTIPLPKKPGE
jgi:hypothetical protein